MASASSPPCEELLLCSICLGAFTEPVSTPCGHNYCKTCITGYWACSDLIQCPLCKKKFRKRPQLQVNTEFRDMVEHFNNMRVRSEDETVAKPGEVPCDICLGLKLKAQKTCLVCLASYCQPHLEPHQRVAALKKHALIDPVSNLEERVCKRHDKIFELFCHTDQMCVCFMCLKDDHVTHEAVPLEHAFKERKAQLEYVASEMKMIEDAKASRLEEIKHSTEQRKKAAEKDVADIDEVFAGLVASLQRSKVKLIELIEEKQEAAGKPDEDHVMQLEQEVNELRRRRSNIEELLQTEDQVRLLKSWPSFFIPAHNKDLFYPSTSPFTEDLSDTAQPSYVGMVKKAVAQMEKTLSNEMETLIWRVTLSDGSESDHQPDAAEELVTDETMKEVWNPPRDKLMMIQQCNEVDVTLDSTTANPRLKVYENEKKLRFYQERVFSDPALNSKRFNYHPLILAKECFSTGRFYYEVRVSGCTGWFLGVVKESFIRGFFQNYERDGWGFSRVQGQDGSFSHNVKSGPLHLRNEPQTVGVFVDCEKGEVSFYDVDARTLIYSYTGCVFTESHGVLKALFCYFIGIPLSSRPKLYPIFGIFGEDPNSVLEITPVSSET